MFSTLAATLIGLAATAAPIEADFVIRGAEIHDGSGAAGKIGDVAIRGERIVGVGAFEVKGQPRMIDGAGLIVAPGFIDLHNHSDRSIVSKKTRGNLNYLWQGCTTIVTGNCGSGPVDVAAYLNQIDEQGAGTNVAHLLPQGSLRRQVVGNEERPATADEIEAMKQLAEQAMRDGAWGMSTGLIYVPSSYASTDELVEVMKVVAGHGGIYATHMRNENTRLLEAIREALEIGQRSGAAVHISHFKASGLNAWGLAADAVELVKEARAGGQTVTADQYPYTASSTSLAAMTIPAKYRDWEVLADALADPDKGPQVREAIEGELKKRGDGQRLFVAGYSTNRDWQGKNLADIAKQIDKPVLDVVLEIQSNGGASMVNFGMSEEEVRLIMQQPFVATASDGSAKHIDDNTVPHPRSYGTFPRKIGRYAIAGKTIPIELAIRSSSGLPADVLQLPERGYLREDYFADVIVFDPATFRDIATFDKPHQYATGVRYLLVNGKLAIDDGRLTDPTHGRSLRHKR